MVTLDGRRKRILTAPSKNRKNTSEKRSVEGLVAVEEYRFVKKYERGETVWVRRRSERR